MAGTSKNVLLCFDAFGTLFKPRLPIYTQYGEVARRYGIDSFTDQALKASFKEAFEKQMRNYPNYGKASGMRAESWWTNIIQETFRPFLPDRTTPLPPALASSLIERFRGREGYIMYDDAYEMLRALDTPSSRHKSWRREHRKPAGATDRRLVIGLITNFDDRVMDILPSLNIRIKQLRHGSDVSEHHPSDTEADIDFAIISYDVGVQKPDRLIFDSALDMLKQMLTAEGLPNPSLDDWRTIYVGDELEKDARGAADAGWEAVLIDRPDTDGSLYLGEDVKRDLDLLIAAGRMHILRDLGDLPRLLG